MLIIPAIDIIDGKCVRLNQGDYGSVKVYNQNPLEVALQFQDAGLSHLHLVDLDGAKNKTIINQKVLETIASSTTLKVDFGGGIKSQKDIDIAFNAGANQVSIGSVAVQNPTLFLQWIELYGAEKIILSADCKNKKIATQGWLTNSEIDVVEFIKQKEAQGIKYVTTTDIAKDGMLQGTATELYAEILQQTTCKLIASGGVSSLQDLEALKQMGCYGAIVGKAIYEGKISLNQLSQLC